MWVHVQLSLYGNLLVRTFFQLVSDLVVVVIFEKLKLKVEVIKYNYKYQDKYTNTRMIC